MHVTKEHAERHYEDLSKKPFFAGLVAVSKAVCYLLSPFSLSVCLSLRLALSLSPNCRRLVALVSFNDHSKTISPSPSGLSHLFCLNYSFHTMKPSPKYDWPHPASKNRIDRFLGTDELCGLKSRYNVSGKTGERR